MTFKQNWSEADLLQLIENKESERTELEYKRIEALFHDNDSERKKKVIFEISKDVSAMANAAGGVIIYGIKEVNRLPEGPPKGVNPKEARHEWLEQVIRSNIKRPIEDLRIIRVSLENTSPGQEAIVISIPQTLVGHQANDGRYYQRQNFSIVMLEDYQIRDLLNRPKNPVIEVTIDHRLLDKGDGKVHRYGFEMMLANIGPIRIRVLRVEIEVPIRMFQIEGSLNHIPNYETYKGITRRPSGLQYESWHIIYLSVTAPIFPTQEINILGWHSNTKPYLSYTVDQEISTWIENNDVALTWKVYADNMPPKIDEIPMKKIQQF